MTHRDTFDQWLRENSGSIETAPALFLSAIGDAAERIFERIPFSDGVVENGEIVKTCDLGHRHVIRAFHWRSLFVRVLQIMRQAERGMTAAEIRRKFPPAEQPTAAKCPSELIHFGAVAMSGKRGGDRLYRITKEGEAYLDGVGELPEFAWPVGVLLPEDAPKPRLARVSGPRMDCGILSACEVTSEMATAR